MAILQSKGGRDYTGKTQDPSRPLQVQPINTLYLNAKSTTVVVGEPFVVDVRLHIGEGTAVDSLSFVLRYDPEMLLPIQGKSNTGEWVPANSLAAPNPGGDSKSDLLTRYADRFTVDENRVDTAEGRIVFSMSAPKTILQDNGAIAHVTFVPLQKTDRASIDFLFDGKENVQTGLLLEGQDLLGTKGNPADGVVPLRLRIADSAGPAESGDTPARAKIENRGDGQLKLRLVSEHPSVDVGDTFDVYVQLDNPDQQPLDSVNLLILYNPQVLQVLDSDPSSSGVNINDQVSPTQFPLDFAVENSVDNDKGMIDYRKKAYGTTVRGTGCLASIRFRALRPTMKTEFRILIDEAGQSPTTGVCYRNHDVLGSSESTKDGIASTSVSIRTTTASLN